MKIKYILLFLVVFSAKAQKMESNHNVLQTIEDSSLVIAFSKNYTKVQGQKENKLLFIDTKSDVSKELDFSSIGTIAKIETNIKTLYKESRFILVEVTSNAQKILPKASGFIRELYLIKLSTYEITKLSSDNFNLLSWVINEDTNTLVFLEKENGQKNANATVQKIVTIKLETGKSKEVLKIN